MKVICSNDESLYRPEVVRWRNRMNMMKPLGDVIVVLPCSMKKPYSNSKSHQSFKRASKGYQELIVTSPFGICPRELENTFPIQSYDVAVSGDWSNEEIKLSGELLKEYTKNKKVIANVTGGYEEVCRNYLDDCVYTCNDDKPTSNDSIYNLRMELKKYKKINRKDRLIHKLKSISKYQFGLNGDSLINDETVVKGRYHKQIYYNHEQIAILNMDYGLFRLNLPGGELLKENNINIVEINFDLKTNTLFAPGVIKADKNILPNDEVVIVNNDEVVAVGKAVLTGGEMELSDSGVAVKIRHRKK